MAVPSLAYVTAGQRLLATYQNSIKDYLDFLLNKPGASAYRTVAGTSVTATWSSAVGLDGEDYDRDGMHNPSTNNSRITFNTAGRYRVLCRHTYVANSAGIRAVSVNLNSGSNVLTNPIATNTAAGNSAALATTVEVNFTMYFGSGDYIEYFVYQNSGGSLSYSTGIRQCMLEAIMEGTN